jgi:hypothetical protein
MPVFCAVCGRPLAHIMHSARRLRMIIYGSTNRREKVYFCFISSFVVTTQLVTLSATAGMERPLTAAVLPTAQHFSTDPNSSGLRHVSSFAGEAAYTSLIEIPAITYE